MDIWTSSSKWDIWLRSGQRIQNGMLVFGPGQIWDPGPSRPGTRDLGTRTEGPGPRDSGSGTPRARGAGPRDRPKEPGPGTRIRGPGPGDPDPDLGPRDPLQSADRKSIIFAPSEWVCQNLRGHLPMTHMLHMDMHK